MVRVRGTDDLLGVGPWWQSLPPISKTIGTIWFGAALGLSLQVLPIRNMGVTWKDAVMRLQVWRLLTNFTVIGGFSLRFLFSMLWWFQYSPSTETLLTQFNPGEYAFLILFCMAVLNLWALFMKFLIPIDFGASPLLFAVIYIWSRNNAQQEITFYGLIPIKAFYTPYVYLAIDLLVGTPIPSILQDLVGIGVGHLYYFLTNLYPLATGQHIMKCPVWLSRFMGKFYRGAVQPQAARREEGRFMAFQGQGRRLGN